MYTLHRFSENSIALYTLSRKEIKRFLRIWSQTLLPAVVNMALYFIVFGRLMGAQIGEIAGVSYIAYIMPGLILMSIITNAYGNVVASFFTAKFQRNIEEMLISPMPNAIILWGYVLGGLMRGLLVGALVAIISLFFTRLWVAHIGIVLLVSILTAILFSLAGFINGVFAKKFDDINIIPTFVLTPLTYLGGVFYSVQMLPELGRFFSYMNPIFYMVNAFRYGILGESDVNIKTALWMMIILTGIVYGFAIWLLNKGVGLKN